MFRLKWLDIIRPNYKNTKGYNISAFKVEIWNLKFSHKVYPPFILVVGPNDGETFLAETCILFLTEYNVVLTDLTFIFKKIYTTNKMGRWPGINNNPKAGDCGLYQGTIQGNQDTRPSSRDSKLDTC
jgi:hypothetical protein